jgi:hypothetical protein
VCPLRHSDAEQSEFASGGRAALSPVSSRATAKEVIRAAVSVRVLRRTVSGDTAEFLGAMGSCAGGLDCLLQQGV